MQYNVAHLSEPGMGFFLKPPMNKAQILSANVLVTGDAMLDRYWFGDAERISPEAPVPVVRIARSEDRLGGAANVALNIAQVGAHATLLSVVGEDTAGHRIEELLHASGIEAALQFDPTLATTEKLRIIARQQQMLRCDFESYPDAEVLLKHLDLFEQSLEKADALVLSDYGKGGLTHITKMIAHARAKNCPILVDPKGDDYERYRGATVITPNRAELRQVIGAWRDEADLVERAQNLRTQLDLEYLLLTRSEEGMTLFSREDVLTVPAQAREVFDVSGAGDTVIAVLATLVAAHISIPEAVAIANKAGGIVVGKLGTASVTYDELFS